MGYGNSSSSHRKFFKTFLNISLALIIKRTGRLIEDQYRRILKENSGYGDPLLLSAGKSCSSLTHLGVKAVWKSFDKVQKIGILCRLNYFFHCRVLFSVGNILFYRTIEKIYILLNDTDVGPQRLLGDISYVGAVDPDTSAGNLIEPGQERAQRSLSSAGWANDGHIFTGIHMQVYVVKHRFFFFIGKRHIAVVNNSRDVRKLFCIRFINYRGHGIHYLAESLKAGHALLKLLRKFYKNVYRIYENVDVEGVDCKVLAGHAALGDKESAGHQNRYKHHSLKEIVTGEKQRHLPVVGLL